MKKKPPVEDLDHKDVLDHKTVAKLENHLLEAIVEVVLKMGLERLPLLPSHHTMHLMAKAAVAVYEAAAENCRVLPNER